jgi:hypothetical protein
VVGVVVVGVVVGGAVVRGAAVVDGTGAGEVGGDVVAEPAVAVDPGPGPWTSSTTAAAAAATTPPTVANLVRGVICTSL